MDASRRKTSADDVDKIAGESIINESLDSTGKPESVESEIRYIEVGIDGATVMHLAGNAKKSDILSGYQRRALYTLGKSLAKWGNLTEKQAVFLNELLLRAKRDGLESFACGIKDCKRCREFKAYDPRK